MTAEHDYPIPTHADGVPIKFYSYQASLNGDRQVIPCTRCAFGPGADGQGTDGCTTSPCGGGLYLTDGQHAELLQRGWTDIVEASPAGYELPGTQPVPCTSCAFGQGADACTTDTCGGPFTNPFTDTCGGPFTVPATDTQPAPAPEAPVAGRKDDSGKRDVTLTLDDLPNALYAVTEVLQWAVTKKQPVPYERGSWQEVDNFFQRYRAALNRHQLDAAISAKAKGERIELQRDHETGLLQLAHVACDALFQLELVIRELNQENT